MESGVAIEVNGVEPLAGVMTLGVYRFAAALEDGRHARALSEVGALIHRAKYTPSDRSPVSREDALAHLSGLLSRQLADHPLFQGTQVIIGAPSTSTGFSEALATWMAEAAGIDLAMAVDERPGGRPRKERDVPRAYRVEAELSGRRAVVLDDVFGSGTTMRALGVAAYKAEAESVVGLAAARLLQD